MLRKIVHPNKAVELSVILDPASLQLALLYLGLYLVITTVMQSFKCLSVDDSYFDFVFLLLKI
jgi:hypothetical protein